jgi:hypothetical protein
MKVKQKQKLYIVVAERILSLPEVIYSNLLNLQIRKLIAHESGDLPMTT